MAYKIAIASTDRIHIDRTFREADSFIIYEVNSDGKYEFLEERRFGDGSENGVSCDKGRTDVRADAAAEMNVTIHILLKCH